MRRLLLFIGAAAGGYLGWWAGEGIGFMTAFLLSTLGSILGIYLAWRIHRDYLD